MKARFLLLVFLLVGAVAWSQSNFEYRVRKPVHASEKPAPLLLMLHGYRSNADDLFSLAGSMPEEFVVVSLQAPANLGPAQYAWYPLQFSGGTPLADESKLNESVDYVRAFVRKLRQEEHIDSTRIYLMGFSQGASMSYATALLHPGEVRGVAACSGRILETLRKQELDGSRLEGLRVFVSHGTQDQVIAYGKAEEARAYLKGLGIEADFHSYKAGHTLTDEMIQALVAWLQADGAGK